MRTAAEILADRPTPRTALSVLQACPDLAERIAALAVRASGTSAGAALGWDHRHQWQPAHPENDPPGLPSGKIKHAVLVIGGRRAKGPSHWQAFLKFSQDFPSAAKVSDKLGVKEGFETESGHFLTRNQAALYVGHHDNALTSEAAEDAGIHLTTRDGQLYTQDAVQAASPKFGCLMAMTPELAGAVQEVARQIRPEDLAEDGVETEPHVTVLYGFNLDFDPSRLEPLLKQAGPITLRLGKVERFECPEYDVIKFGVQSPDLVWLNTALSQTFAGEISPSKWDYNPHVTIAYVKKGACQGLTSPSEGLTLTTTQLLYSLPDRQGRRTFDVVRASTPQTNHAHSVIQDEAQAVYEEGLQKAKDKRSKAALLLLLLSLGTRAYLKAYTALARLENVPLGPNLRREAVRFAKGRRRFLKPFLSALGGPEASLSKTSPDLPADLQRRIQLVAATEAQATYGQAQLRVLQRAGYTTKNWVTVGDDRVRESHVRCESQRDIPMDQRFSNGLLYPGDPAGGPEEVCNCRCWLEGGSKRPVVTASHVREHLSHSKTGKTFVVREHDTKHTPLSEKAQRAKDAHHLIDRKVQRYAEEHNEPAFARAVGGVSFRDNEPVDIVIADKTGVVAHGIELKTVVSNKAQKITMKEDALRRKRSWERKNKATIHTVVLDDTLVFNANGEGKHDLSKRRIFYRRGYGSFRISNMHQVADLEELKSLLDTPRRSLPKGAR